VYREYNVIDVGYWGLAVKQVIFPEDLPP